MKSGYISIIGKPNSGKSTLLNKILGEELSIVTHKAQTTRQKIVGIHNVPGAQMIFLDTPGIHDSKKPINQYMMGVVDAAHKDADVICIVIDITDKDLTDLLDQKITDSENVIIVLNKLDLIMDRPWQSVADEYKTKFPKNEVVGISAKTGLGVDELVANLIEKLPEGEPFYPDDIYTEHPVRFLVAEIIREQVLLNMHQEVPYSVAVEIEDYKEQETIHKIHAAVIVEKESQKRMIIGTGGKMIKKIGQTARVKIESLVGMKVFLKLFVKVEQNWTKDQKAIKRLYGDL
jgi:GTP-binding protein Era